MNNSPGSCDLPLHPTSPQRVASACERPGIPPPLGGLMKSVLVCLGIALAFGACKKSSTGPTPGGGGGGGTSWLVGTDGLMVNVSTTGTAQGYDLSSKETLNRIACRYA